MASLTYAEYGDQRHQQLLEDYARGPLTDKLYASYRPGSWPVAFSAPAAGASQRATGGAPSVLRLEPYPLVEELLRCYRLVPGGGNKLRPLHGALLPGRFARQLREMERAPDAR